MRKASVERETEETKVQVVLNLDGGGTANINTGIGFFDHMLELFCLHGLMDFDIKADGDTWVDYHHTVEDIGIVLGQALGKVLGDKSGIKRYSSVFVPMDESLVMVAMDISGRPYLHFDVAYTGEKVGDFDLELIKEFLKAFVINSGLTLHIRLIHGENNHHISEGIFKGMGMALDDATLRRDRIKGVMSTKGVL